MPLAPYSRVGGVDLSRNCKESGLVTIGNQGKGSPGPAPEEAMKNTELGHLDSGRRGDRQGHPPNSLFCLHIPKAMCQALKDIPAPQTPSPPGRNSLASMHSS